VFLKVLDHSYSREVILQLLQIYGEYDEETLPIVDFPFTIDLEKTLLPCFHFLQLSNFIFMERILLRT
jgi:hypothetical protein